MKLFPFLSQFISGRYFKPYPEVAGTRAAPKKRRRSKRFLLFGLRSPSDQLQIVAIEPRRARTSATLPFWIVHRTRQSRAAGCRCWRGVACNAFGRQAESAQPPSTIPRKGAASSSPPGSRLQALSNMAGVNMPEPRIATKRSGSYQTIWPSFSLALLPQQRRRTPVAFSVYRFCVASLGAVSALALIHSSIACSVLAFSFALNRIRLAVSSISAIATGLR